MSWIARSAVGVQLSVVLSVIAGAALAGAAAQTQRDTPARPVAVVKGSAVLAGIVTSDDSRSVPIRRALVTLTGGAGGIVQTATDDDGRFAFVDLPAGSYALIAEKPGYVKTFVGSRRAGRGPSTPMGLQDGQRLTTVAIKLLRGAVIAGTVFDENGHAVPSAQVTVLQPHLVNGERRIVSVPGIASWATTDDRGRYRFYGVPPGEYTVRSSGGQAIAGEVRLTTQADVDAATRPLSAVSSATLAPQPQVFPSFGFHPAARDAAGAAFFTVVAGEERLGIDVRVGLSRAVRVEGVALGPGGQTLSAMSVGITNVSTGSQWASPGFVRPRGEDGRFVLPAMPSGRYLFYGRAAAAAGAAETLWTETEVVVGDQDVSGVTLQFQPGSTVAGRVTYQNPAASPSAGLRVALTPVPTIAGAAIAPEPVSPQADGSFSFMGVPPGRYRVAITSAGTWSLRSAVLSGRDTLDELLDVSPGQPVSDLIVTLTDRPTEVSGTLLDASGRPASGYVVIIFSTDRTHWTIAPRRSSGVVRIGASGTYRVTSLPPGEYHLAALIDADPQDTADPFFLDQLVPVSLKITLSEGERKQQDLRIGG
jgi:uncharacterized protein (DUF2141 family)